MSGGNHQLVKRVLVRRLSDCSITLLVEGYEPSVLGVRVDQLFRATRMVTSG